MLCPICKKNELSETILHNVGVDYCSECLGFWFEEDELRLAKDKKDKNINWLDIDLWQDKTKFKIACCQKLCPKCRLPLYEVEYGDSGIHPVKSAKGGAEQFNRVKVDVCNLCLGIWLDQGEFKKIVEYLQEKASYEILHNYAKNLIQESWEVFTGPETLREEVADFLTVLKLFNHKFIVQYPNIVKTISQLPK